MCLAACTLRDNDRLVWLLIIGVCYMMYIVIGWNVRDKKDGFFLRDEMMHIALVMFVQTLTTAASSVEAIGRDSVSGERIFPLIIWLENMFALAVTCIYPVAKSYGLGYHPLLPWTWLSICLLRRSLRKRSTREEGLSLRDILTNDEHTVTLCY